MQQVINEKLIKRNKMIGNIMSIGGISILAVGLFLNLNTEPDPMRTMVSFLALIFGFIIAQISTYYVTRFGRSPRFDEIVGENLSKLNNQFTYYVYSSPIPILLVGPSGLWIPIPVSASGEIFYDEKWKQRGGSFILKLLGQEKIGRPELDIKANEKEIQKFFTKHFEEETMPPIHTILVSLNPKATIGDTENAPTPIIEVGALRRKIKKITRNTEEDVSQEMINRINDLLGG